MTILQKQYAMVRQCREAAFNYIENTLGEAINTPLPAFNNNSISSLLVHTASCYMDWLQYFALKRPVSRAKQAEHVTIASIRTLFNRIDDTMAVFLERFAGDLNEVITGTSDGWPPTVSATPLEVFTHVVAHEFHHKGQVMLMCRQLGQIPPDTDIYVLFTKVDGDGNNVA